MACKNTNTKEKQTTSHLAYLDVTQSLQLPHSGSCIPDNNQGRTLKVVVFVTQYRYKSKWLNQA